MPIAQGTARTAQITGKIQDAGSCPGSMPISEVCAPFVDGVEMFALVEIWLVLSLLVAYAGTIAAVVRDARARVDNPSAARAAALLAAVLPIVGGALWLCLRPAETRLARRERRLVLAAFELPAPASVPVSVPAPAPAEPARAAA